MAYQSQIEGKADQRRVGGRRSGNEHGLRAAVLHAVFGCREELDGWREVCRSPLVGARLGIANSDEIDARLLKGENLGPEGTQSAQADEAELEARLNGHVGFDMRRAVCQ